MMGKPYSLDHPLGSSCLKLERAQLHLSDLMTRINEALFTDAAADRGESQWNPFPDGIPEEWSTLIGDFVSNLRHALDHLAWALANKERVKRGEMIIPENEARNIFFPLCESTASFPPKYFDRLWPPAHTAIEAFQPYHRSDWPELELLGILHELSNRDKHRVVTATNEARMIRLSDGKEFTAIFDHRNTPTSLASVQIHSFGGPDDELGSKTTSDVVVHSYVYRYGGTVSVTSEFPQMHSLVRDKVIAAFACFFE